MCDKKAAPSKAEQWTVQKVEGLGMTCGIETAGSILGIGRTVSYRLAREGQWPTPIRKVGGRYLVTVKGLLDFLGGADQAASNGPE